jgi:hypothetical protein
VLGSVTDSGIKIEGRDGADFDFPEIGMIWI